MKGNAMTSRMAYPIPEAAQHLGISRTHLYALHRQGRITFTKIGRRTTVTHDELQRFLDQSADLL